MTTNIKGKLVDGFGKPIANAQMQAVATQTGIPIAGATAYSKTDANGNYDFSLEIGTYAFSIWFGDLGYQYVGNIEIIQGTPDASLDQILVIPPSAQPMVLTKILQSLVDAENAAKSAADEVRDTLIPLGQLYATLAAAQADIANIPAGSTAYYRSPDDSALAIEVINNSGVLVATGRKMPSQKYIDLLKFNLGETNSLVTSLLDLLATVTTQGVTEVTVRGKGLVVLKSASIASGTNYGEISVNHDSGVLFSKRIYPGETLQDGKFTTPYKTADIVSASAGLTLVDIGTSVTRIATTVASVPNASFDGFISVYDLDSVFTPINQGGQQTALVPTCVGHVSGKIYFGVLNEAITGAGYELTPSGVLAYFKATYPNLRMYYRSTESAVSDLIVSGVSTGDVTVNIASAVQAAVEVYGSASGGNGNDGVMVSPLSVYNADITNPSAFALSGVPSEIKIKFEAKEVTRHSAIRVVDINGTEYPCQFAGTLDANMRKNSDLSYYTDLSFNTGSLIIMTDMAAGETKKLRIEAYGSESLYSEAAYPELTMNDSTSRYEITVGEYTWVFSSVTGLLLSVSRAGETLTSNTIKRITGITDGSAVENTGSANYEIRLINTGPLFAEVEVITTHPEQGNVPLGSVRSVTRYRMFNNGALYLQNFFQAVNEIAPNALYAVRMDINYAFGNSTTAKFDDAAGVFSNAPVSDSGVWTLVNEYVVADTLRDVASNLNTWGARRPLYSRLLAQSSSEWRMRSGFSFSDVGDNSLTGYIVPKNWVWPAAHWSFPFQVGNGTISSAANCILNRPVGMAYKGISSYVLKHHVLSKMQQLADGIYDLYTNKDSGQVKPTDAKFYEAYRYPQIYGLLKSLREGVDFETQYSRFKTYITDRMGSYSNAGPRYLAGTDVLQFTGRMTFAAVDVYYRYAEKHGYTEIMEDLHVFIDSICNALVTRVGTSGGMPLTGSESTNKGNGNSNAEGIRMLAIGIYAGRDTSGQFLAAINTTVAMIKGNLYASYAHPVVMDGFGVMPSKNRWLAYECHGYYVMQRAWMIMRLAAAKYTAAGDSAKAADIISAIPDFDNSRYLIGGTLGNGSPDYQRFIIAEDRRGFVETAGAMAVGLMNLDSVSAINTAYLLLTKFEQDFSTDPIAQPHLADFRQLTYPLTVAYEGFEHAVNQFALVLLDRQYLDS